MTVHFVLKRYMRGFEEYGDLYEAIKTGKKTSEFRDATDDYWAKRLLNDFGLKIFNRFKEIIEERPISFAFRFTYARDFIVGVDPATGELFSTNSDTLKHKEATFRVGYTKGPTLRADIKDVLWRPMEKQFEVRLGNVVEE